MTQEKDYKYKYLKYKTKYNQLLSKQKKIKGGKQVHHDLLSKIKGGSNEEQPQTPELNRSQEQPRLPIRGQQRFSENSIHELNLDPLYLGESEFEAQRAEAQGAEAEGPEEAEGPVEGQRPEEQVEGQRPEEQVEGQLPEEQEPEAPMSRVPSEGGAINNDADSEYEDSDDEDSSDNEEDSSDNEEDSDNEDSYDENSSDEEDDNVNEDSIDSSDDEENDNVNEDSDDENSNKEVDDNVNEDLKNLGGESSMLSTFSN